MITMVQATQSRHGYDPASCIGNLHFFPTCRRSLSPTQDASDPRGNDGCTQSSVALNDARRAQSHGQVNLFCSSRPTFCDTVLPWTAETGSFRCDAEALYDAYDIVAEVCGTVKDQVPGYRVVRKSPRSFESSSFALPQDERVQLTYEVW